MGTLDRYHRQMLLPAIGEEGQRALGESSVFIAGCGALGTVAIDLLARAGVGTLVIVDRDVVEETNLQRQTLFVERDAARSIPKAEAAKTRVALVNSGVKVRAFVENIAADTLPELAEECDLLLDGLDNFQTRYLLNDYAVREGIPYLYGAAVATTGMSMPILPNTTPTRRIKWSPLQSTGCFRCVFPEPPPPGQAATCDTAGVLGMVTAAIAGHLATQTIKLLVGAIDEVDRSLLSIDVWANETRRLAVVESSDPECVCCGKREFSFLDASAEDLFTMLCGRNAVQIRPPRATDLDLVGLAAKLAAHGTFSVEDGALRGDLVEEEASLIVFPDGRAIISGSTDFSWAQGIYDRFIGQ
jgi:adenylyltransferase/sulfurtransferase